MMTRIETTERYSGPIIENPWLRWAVVFLCFTAVGMYFTTRDLLADYISGRPLDIGLANHKHMLYYYAWLVLTPLITTFTRSHRFERGAWPRSLVLHVALSAVLAPAHFLIWKLSAVPIVLGGLSQAIALDPPALYRSLAVEMFTGVYKYWLIVGLYSTFDYYRILRLRARQTAELRVKAAQLAADLSQARLDALRLQLHPHFLFNTLNTISVLVEDDPETANRMVLGLGELLRAALQHQGADTVLLKQELEVLDRYLAIEKIRFSDRLRISVDVEPEALDKPIPHLVLQPLVENAIRHGIAPREEGGEVRVEARLDGEKLIVGVLDNGVGLGGRSVRQIFARGIGLANIRDRLRHLYGSEGELTLNERLGGGAAVSIRIPVKEGR